MSVLSAILSFKGLIVILVAVIIWHLFRLRTIGRELAADRSEITLARHRGTVACVGCLTLLAVLMIEMVVRMHPSPYEAPPIVLAFHFFVVTLLVFVFCTIVFKFTGIFSPMWHRPLAYAFFAIYAVVILSGGVLLYQL